MSNKRVTPERRADKLLERREGRAFDACEGIQDLETPDGVEDLLDHLRVHFKPVEMFRRGRVVDDVVCNFDRPSGEEIKKYEPLSDAMLTSIPQTHASRRGVPLCRKQSGVDYAPVIEAHDEEESRSSRKMRLPVIRLEIEHKDAVAVMTLGKQRRAEVNRARQFSRKTSVTWREQGPARQGHSEISMCERRATGSLERR